MSSSLITALAQRSYSRMQLVFRTYEISCDFHINVLVWLLYLLCSTV